MTTNHALTRFAYYGLTTADDEREASQPEYTTYQTQPLKGNDMSYLEILSVGTFYKVQCLDSETGDWVDVSLPRNNPEAAKECLKEFRSRRGDLTYRVAIFEVKVTLLGVMEEE